MAGPSRLMIKPTLLGLGIELGHTTLFTSRWRFRAFRPPPIVKFVLPERGDVSCPIFFFLLVGSQGTNSFKPLEVLLPFSADRGCRACLAAPDIID
jgi:hypothetical protein